MGPEICVDTGGQKQARNQDLGGGGEFGQKWIFFLQNVDLFDKGGGGRIWEKWTFLTKKNPKKPYFFRSLRSQTTFLGAFLASWGGGGGVRPQPPWLWAWSKVI